MTSPFSTLLISLQERIKAQVPAIRWIDQEFGQLENYGDRIPVSWPCVLIDFDNFQFEDAGELIQFAQGEVILRLAFPPFSATNNLTPTFYKEKALQYYDIEWAIYKALHGWKPENYGYMSRVSADTEKREDPIRVRTIRFSISFEDYNAQPEYNRQPLPDNLEVENT